MITPKWLRTRNQPIAIRNVLKYLSDCIEVPETIGEVYDIGGPDIITYRQFMESYAEIMRLPKRLIFPIPFFTPNLSSYWIRLITGIQSSLARPLIDGMKNEVVCHDFRIRELIPQKLIDHKQAIRLALNPKQYLHGSDYRDELPAEWHIPGDPNWSGGLVFQDHRKVILDENPKNTWQILFQIIREKRDSRISLLWTFGAFLGAIFNRGRMKKELLYKVNTVPEKELTLHTDVVLPGYVIIRYRIRRINHYKTELHQIIRIIPKGIIGIIYWLAIWPFFTRKSKKNLEKVIRRIPGNPPIYKVFSTTKPYSSV
jgi:hypothetical protein